MDDQFGRPETMGKALQKVQLSQSDYHNACKAEKTAVTRERQCRWTEVRQRSLRNSKMLFKSQGPSGQHEEPLRELPNAGRQQLIYAKYRGYDWGFRAVRGWRPSGCNSSKNAFEVQSVKERRRWFQCCLKSTRNFITQSTTPTRKGFSVVVQHLSASICPWTGLNSELTWGDSGISPAPRGKSSVADGRTVTLNQRSSGDDLPPESNSTLWNKTAAHVTFARTARQSCKSGGGASTPPPTNAQQRITAVITAPSLSLISGEFPNRG